MSNSILGEALKTILNERLSKEQIDELKAEGYKLKSPTRKTALAVAIYKRAEKGDLAAIKEMRSILCECDTSSADGEKVVIIDDTRKENS